MFKYSRHFIILFFAITVLPLFLMFVFHQKHDENMHIHHSHNIFRIGLEQLRNNIAPYSISDYEKIDFNKVFPSGPFTMELYKGNVISEENLLYVVRDRYAPPPHPMENNNYGIPENKKEPYDVIKIKDDKGNVKYSILLKMFHHAPPFRFMNIGLLVFVLGIISSLVMGFCLQNTFLNPLVQLSGALKKMQKGDMNLQMETDSKQKELKNVFENFNGVVNSLREKEELRTNFISNLTHDLRTPLIAQERTLELISKEFEDLKMPDAYKLSRSLEKNNQHILRMVNLILEAYRFDTKELQLNFSKENISEIISETFEHLEVLAKDKDIRLKNNVSFDLPTIPVDKGSLKRVFINLVSNSIANTQEGGTVEVDSVCKDDFLQVIVKDNGNGILDSDLKNIFDRYYVGKGYERNIGSGLGLYVCKEIVQLHGGKISVESEKGKYTEFLISLPLIR